jgi:hypothetical protein
MVIAPRTVFGLQKVELQNDVHYPENLLTAVEPAILNALPLLQTQTRRPPGHPPIPNFLQRGHLQILFSPHRRTHTERVVSSYNIVLMHS